MGLFQRGRPSFLPDKDYLPLAMPTTELAALDVLTRGGGALRRYGSLTDVLAADDPLPADVLATDHLVVDSAGVVDRSKKAGLTLSLVNALIKALGGNAGLDASGSAVSSVSFAYTDLRSDTAEIARLDSWLAGADLRIAAPRAADLLVAEMIYLAVGRLSASGIAVTLRDARDAAVALDVPTVQQLVGGKVSVSVSGERSAVLTFQGPTRLTIAAKVAQLKVDNRGFWIAEQPLSDGEIRDLAGARPEYLKDAELRLAA